MVSKKITELHSLAGYDANREILPHRLHQPVIYQQATECGLSKIFLNINKYFKH